MYSSFPNILTMVELVLNENLEFSFQAKYFFNFLKVKG